MKYAQMMVLLALIFVILNETLDWTIIPIGVVAGFFAIWFTNRLLEIDYLQMFDVNWQLILTYVWIIVRDTYILGFDMVLRILKGDINPQVFTYKSELKDEFLLTLLSNAITFPPGSITVDRDGENMTVLTIMQDKEKFRKEIYEKIEKPLAEFDRR